jgi:hypothetical protein
MIGQSLVGKSKPMIFAIKDTHYKKMIKEEAHHEENTRRLHSSYTIGFLVL